MKIFLTGKSGFIGKNIFNGLVRNYDLIAYSHKELDLLDFKSVKDFFDKNKVDVIIHSAVGSGEHILDGIIRIFISIIANSQNVKRVIYFGSGAEYAKQRDLVKVKESENGQHIPLDSYGFGKFVCHEMVRKNKKFINLRLFGVFGQHENYRDKFISNAIVKNILGIPIKIKQDVVFDYLYITDLVRLLKWFIEGDPNFTSYNMTPTESIKLTQIVQIINQIERKSEIQVVNNGLNYEYTGDNSRLRQFIPTFEFTPYEKSIRELYSFYKKNLHLIDKSVIMKDEYFRISKIRNKKNEKSV